MQKKQATGLDTRAMLPLYSMIYSVLSVCMFPWISIPMLPYAQFPEKYSIWETDLCIKNLQASLEQTGIGILPKKALTTGEVELFHQGSVLLQWLAVGVLCVLLWGIFSVYWRKKRSWRRIRIVSAISLVLSAVLFLAVCMLNFWLNRRMGRANSFSNLTIDSFVQLTAWQYGQMILSVLMLVFAEKLFDMKKENEVQRYLPRKEQTDRRIGKRTRVAIVLIVCVIPLVIWFGIFFLNNRSELFIALCMIGLSGIPFLMVFEERRPQAREILLIAVMSAIAVAGRMAFFMLPQFKPVTAIVIITGVALGGEAGFLTGAMAGFVSNFFFGQGPWTPWQMFAFGIIGFLAGILFHRKKKISQFWYKVTLCIYGGGATFLIYGLLMDCASVIMASEHISWQAVFASVLTGIPFNAIHAVSTVIFLFLLAVPMGKKLERMKKKYGILEV